MAFRNYSGVILVKDRYGNRVPLNSKRGKKTLTERVVQLEKKLLSVRKPIRKNSLKSKLFYPRRRSW